MKLYAIGVNKKSIDAIELHLLQYSGIIETYP